jgi:hypothetical protein
VPRGELERRYEGMRGESYKLEGAVVELVWRPLWFDSTDIE